MRKTSLGIPITMIPLKESDTASWAQHEVRLLYHLAANEKQHCEKLIAILQPYNENNHPVWAGYKASAMMMMAKYTLNPFRKLSRFSEGKLLLEKCIASDNENIELRFLRYAAQMYSPAFLGFRNEIHPDQTFLRDACLNLKDTQLKETILSFLKSSEETRSLSA